MEEDMQNMVEEEEEDVMQLQDEDYKVIAEHFRNIANELNELADIFYPKQ